MYSYTFDHDKTTDYTFWIVLIILPLFYFLGWLSRDEILNNRFNNFHFSMGPMMERMQTQLNIIMPIPKDNFNEINQDSENVNPNLNAPTEQI